MGDDARHDHEHAHGRDNDQNSKRRQDRFQFLLVSHKDTDILTLNTAKCMLPLDFPSFETINLGEIKEDADMKRLVTSELYQQQPHIVILVRLLGRGVPGFSHLLEYAEQKDHDLIVVSGVPGSFEPDLTAMCTVSTETIHQVMAYFNADGCSHNMTNMFCYLADHLLKCGFGYDAPSVQPDHGLYHPQFQSSPTCDREHRAKSYLEDCYTASDRKPTICVIFYRCHFLSENTSFVDAILDELEALDLNAIGLFTETLREHKYHGNVNGTIVERFPTALTYLLDKQSGNCL
eukprot:2903596-Ditylum_brightwellii.AAC.1